MILTKIERKEYNKKYYIKNRKKLLNQCKNYKKNNKKLISKRNKIYTLNNKKEKQIYDKKYRKENKEKIKKYQINYGRKNKNKINLWHKKYRKTEKGRLQKLKDVNKRRSKCKVTDITLDYLFQLNYITEFCPICKRKLTNGFKKSTSKHIDHIIPLAIGGKHKMNNIRIICKKCNLTRPKNGSDINE